LVAVFDLEGRAAAFFRAGARLRDVVFAAFFLVVFLAVAFFAGVFFAEDFLAGAFRAAAFFFPADFLEAFLAAFFFGLRAGFLLGAFFRAPEAFFFCAMSDSRGRMRKSGRL
jgi:hypothetical protein